MKMVDEVSEDDNDNDVRNSTQTYNADATVRQEANLLPVYIESRRPKQNETHDVCFALIART